MKSALALVIASSLVVLGCQSGNTSEAPPGATASGPTSSGAVSQVPFARVQAVMAEKCVGCHGAGMPKGGVALNTREAILKGGPGGAIVKAGDPSGSLLVQVMRGAEGHKQMPPMGNPASEEQIKTVEDWIKGGAKAE